MTLFHFGNCVALAYIPYFITYKYSGLAEYSSVWKCGQAAFGYFVTQLVKMLILATVFPTTELEGERFDVVGEFLKSTVDLVDLVGLYLIISKAMAGKGEIRFLASGLGWATADLVATRLFPLFIGARGVEFDWKYIQLSLEANLNLVHYMAVAFLVWAWGRTDLNKTIYPVVSGLLVYSAYRHLVFELLYHHVGITSWSLLLVKALMALGIGLLSVSIYDKQRRRENSY